MSRVVYQGKIDGDFDGFDDEVLFKMKNGTYWLQTQYKYWYHYAFSPDATITEENGQYLLAVAGNYVPVQKISNVIESQIRGEFKGWGGSSVYELQNGQVWKQSSYKYQYTYAYMPAVVVYESGSGYKMSVAGTIANIRQIR
jgi:hypothetical protein